MSLIELQPWDDFIAFLSSHQSLDGEVGLDLEANGLHRFQEEICLVQACVGEKVHLFDPLEEVTLEPVRSWLRDATIWMHGADYDMSLMLMTWDVLPKRILDTQIAAQLLGYERFGYAALVEQVFGVALSKSSQKADWGKRPLLSKMMEYAANDVRYLLPLAKKLESGLREKGRYDWFLQSCDAAHLKVTKRSLEDRESWRISGSGRLEPKALNYLQALWEWRQSEAKEWDRPAFMVTSNKQLLEWTSELMEGESLSIPPKMRSQRVSRLKKAIKKAEEVGQSDYPQKRKRARVSRSKNFESVLGDLLKIRDKAAERLGLAPSVIASRSTLEQLASGQVSKSEILLPWQQDLLKP